MNNLIFRRIEEKYFLTDFQKEQLLKKIDEYIEKDSFYKSNILNIYFDNNNDELVIRSGEKPIYKDKIRLRSYSIPNLDSDVFLEIKNKYEINTQIMKEIDYLFKHYDLKPHYFVGYDRISYKGIDNKNLRITFDTNLRSRKNDLRLENGDYGEKYFDKDIWIMEIKTLDSMPIWLTNILSKLSIYPISFSKYAEIYKKEVHGIC